MANKLINSGSPYLLQHAHNPVDWNEWGEEALQKAKTEDKPIIVSIGYSACHWCHVMERECFENETLAKIMNQHFVCIKVDREERPDIDAIYMDAISNMGLRGGWPLNVFLTSEAKPFYGGTYFPPANWQSILNQVANAYLNHRDEIEKSANSFKESLNRSEVEKYGLSEVDNVVTKGDFDEIYTVFSKVFDNLWGGMNKAPKFPMPANYLFLLRLWKETGNQGALDQVVLTLKRMALGGIYDQVGGGFARYSTDGEWFLPHFEKMLYDNGQLLSLYSEAYNATHEPIFKQVVYETIDFVKRELTSPDGGFYSALDADSEGEEGKFYVWTREEIENILGSATDLFCEYFNVTEEGNWEHKNNILCCDVTIEEYCRSKEMDPIAFYNNVKDWKAKLLAVQRKRIYPGLDNKIIASWNGLMLNGLVDAYRVFDEPLFLELALKNASYIETKLGFSKGNRRKLHHTGKETGKPITGFLEDYAFIIQAYTNLYQATFEEKWLQLADAYMGQVLEGFIDKEEEFFFFTDASGEELIARKKEILDNVIPASNSQMAINLYVLGQLFDHEPYKELAKHNFGKIKKMLMIEPNYLSNWGNQGAYLISPTKEIVISGANAIEMRKEIDKIYLPNKIVAGMVSKGKTKLPLLEGREPKETTLIYICENKVCKLPVDSVEKAIELLF